MCVACKISEFIVRVPDSKDGRSLVTRAWHYGVVMRHSCVNLGYIIFYFFHYCVGPITHINTVVSLMTTRMHCIDEVNAIEKNAVGGRYYEYGQQSKN